MSKEIDNAVGIDRSKDRRHVDSLMAAGGFQTFGTQGQAAPRVVQDAPPRAIGVKGGGVPIERDPPPASAKPSAPTLRDDLGKLKPVKPLVEKVFAKKLRRSPVPPPPKVAWLHLDQLVLDDSYQRDVSEGSLRMIRRMVEQWDWARFKPLSVAQTPAGLYEVVDGQHTAIAAATHGSIDSLPCLVLQLPTQAERAAAFVGVNSERTALKSFALFRGRVVAGEALALKVQGAVTDSGARLVEVVSQSMAYAPGDVACVSTLMGVAKGVGREGLARLLRICVEAGLGPIPAPLIRALDAIVGRGGGGRGPGRRTGRRAPAGRPREADHAGRRLRRPGPEPAHRPGAGAEHRTGAHRWVS